ncbi:MAG: hypothetical protein FWB72_02475 [Firmicutes bacterium]|nr:hypothetical protein [Bacillota bacterium]
MKFRISKFKIDGSAVEFLATNQLDEYLENEKNKEKRQKLLQKRARKFKQQSEKVFCKLHRRKQ